MATVTESQLRHMITSHALQSTSTGWRDWCQRLMWNVSDLVGGVRETYPTATAAYHASRIESRDASLAPPGASHFWHEPYPYGHVAFDLDGGGTRVLMATSFADDWWGNGAGTTSIRAYTNRTGSQYLGWSRDNGKNLLPVLASAATAAAPAPPPAPEPAGPLWKDSDMLPVLVINKIKGHKNQNLGWKFSIDGAREPIKKSEWDFWESLGCRTVTVRTAAQWRLIRTEAEGIEHRRTA